MLEIKENLIEYTNKKTKEISIIPIGKISCLKIGREKQKWLIYLSIPFLFLSLLSFSIDRSGDTHFIAFVMGCVGLIAFILFFFLKKMRLEVHSAGKEVFEITGSSRELAEHLELILATINNKY